MTFRSKWNNSIEEICLRCWRSVAQAHAQHTDIHKRKWKQRTCLQSFKRFSFNLDSSIIKERSIICVSMLHRVYKCVFLMHLDEKYFRICTNINLQSLMLCEICGFVRYLSFKTKILYYSLKLKCIMVLMHDVVDA